MTSIIRIFSQRREEDQVYTTFRRNAVILCLTSFMLLVTGAEMVDSIIVQIVEGITMGRNPTPVILAETMNGLDDCKNDRETYLRGSPMMLSIWLMEHFQLVVPPVRALPITEQFFDRFLAYTGNETVGQWTRWFAKDGISKIRWNVPWWTLGYPLMAMFPNTYVQLAGLRNTSYYSPYRILRQYHLMQIIPDSDDYDDDYSTICTLTIPFARLWTKT